MRRILLAELIARGVDPEPHEAVAITQQLIRSGAASPTPHNVRLGTDGSTECVGCDTTPAVYEIAIFLQTLLPPDRVGVPGGLRYAIARGLHEVEARPFDSIDELSAALNRFEKGDRRAVVAQLVECVVPPEQSSLEAAVEVRAVPVPAPPVSSAAVRKRYWPVGLAAAVALVISALGGFAAVRWLDTPSTRRPDSARQPTIPNEAVTSRAAEPAASLRDGRTPAPIEPADSAGSLPPQSRDVDAPNEPAPPVRPAGAAVLAGTATTGESRGSVVAASGGLDLQVMTIEGDEHSDHVQASPDGRAIAFDSDRDGARGVYVARRDGSDLRRISGAGYALGPAWSPDGRRIAYVRAEPGNPDVWNLWLQSLDDGGESRLTGYAHGQTWSASWFPDGRRICYAHDDQLVIADLESRREQVIASPVAGHSLREPAVSPDGARVIFQVYRQGVWIYALADRSMQYVLTDPTAGEFKWAPDGRHVAFHSRRDGTWGMFVIAE